VFAGCKSTKESEVPEIPPNPPVGSAASPAPSWNEHAPANEDSATIEPVDHGARKHTVQRGDTIFKLAREYYGGDEHQWRKIFDANRDKIQNKDVLKVGQVLVIPD